MGTSSSYNGPNKSPLLPPDFEFDDINIELTQEEADDSSIESQQSEESPDTVTWQAAKTSMTKYVKSSSQTPKRPVSNYVKANGGSKNLTKSAKGGIRSVIALGKFAQSVSTNSFRESLESLGYDWKDKSAQEIIGFLAEKLSPNPSNKEDAAARKAMTETMIEFYQILDEDNGIESFDNIDKSQIALLTAKYIINYIYERIISELGKRFEENTEPKQAKAKEAEVKDYIRATVETSDQLKGLQGINFNEAKIINLVASIYIECYGLLENI